MPITSLSVPCLLVALLAVVMAQSPVQVPGRRQVDGNEAYAAVLNKAAEWQRDHPRLVRKQVIGTSVGGRELFVLRIGAGPEDNAPEMYLGSAIHGYEGSEQDLMWMVDQLLARADQPPVRDLLATRVLWVQPLVNPDGVVAQRRKNDHGVDCNRNFGMRWQPGSSPAGYSYPGPEAFSEPETRAVRDFLRGRAHLRAYLDLHRSTSLIVAPQLGGEGLVTPTVKAAYEDLDAAMGAFTRRGLGMHFSHLHGLSIDWVWGELGVVAFTWENVAHQRAGPVADDPRWRGLLHLLERAGEYPRGDHIAASQELQAPASPDYWIKRLELPATRDLAMERLLTFGPKAVESLTERLADPRPEVQLAAMRVLGLLGKSNQPALASILAIDVGADAELALAAASAADAIRGGRGFLLVVDFSRGKLIELDGRGKERLILGDLPELRSGRLLANGNYLVSARTGVREVTPTGAVVWSFPDVTPNDAVRLPGGNTLIASSDSHRVFEVDAAGKVLWEHTDESRVFRPVSCQRLPDGHTLIADYALHDADAGRVLEVDEQHRIVWQLTWKQPANARRLTGGRTLIVSHKPGRVQIVDQSGKVLQVFNDVDVPSAAEYLPNGHLLVGGDGFVRELDANGVRLWNQPMRWITGVQRH